KRRHRTAIAGGSGERDHREAGATYVGSLKPHDHVGAKPSVTASGSRRQPRLFGLLKLDQVLKNELSPGASSSLDERTALCELPQRDRREAELFNQGPD